ncbi:MAG: hypothetical protein PHN75_02120 [Syntrophales bacterium]|nr:hypothetical protein [Syntrophales bacterium]
MAGDLLDYWVGLIKPIFPANAWIASRFSNNGHLIQIDWKLENDPRHPNKRSRKIEIIIKEDSIEDYLNRNKGDRELSDTTLKGLICERFNRFNSDDNACATQFSSTERWVIPRHVFNGKPPKNSFSGDL